MAITQNTFTGNGSNLGPFSFTFKWLEPTDIKVSVGGVLKTAGTHYNLQNLNYTTKTGGEVLFTGGNTPASGAAIRVFRDTDDSALSSTFNSGSAIRAQDLNDNFTQNLYVTQEINNNAVQIDGSNSMVGDLDMGGYQINNLAEPTVDDDAATKYYIDQRFGVTNIPAHTRWRKTATAGQTTFSGTGDYGGTLTYSALREQVYLNGALQQRSADYTADNGTSIVFSVPLTVGDVVDVVCVNNTNTSGISNAANLSYSGQFSGQTVRTVAAKLADVVSVKDFGAVGDGVADDTAAIQAAINYAESIISGDPAYSQTAVTVYLPGGRYVVSSSLLIRQNSVSLQGAGQGSTGIYSTNSSANIITIQSANAFNGTYLKGNSVRDIWLGGFGAANPSSGVGILADLTASTTIDNVAVIGKRRGIELSGSNQGCTISNCRFSSGNTLTTFNAESAGIALTQRQVASGVANGVQDADNGLYYVEPNSVHIDNVDCQLSANYDAGLLIESCDGLYVSNSYFGFTGGSAIKHIAKHKVVGAQSVFVSNTFLDTCGVTSCVSATKAAGKAPYSGNWEFSNCILSGYGGASTIRLVYVEAGFGAGGGFNGLGFRGCSFSTSTDNLAVIASCSSVRVTGCTLSGATSAGLFLSNCANAIVSSNTFSGGVNGVKTVGTCDGLVVTSNSFKDISSRCIELTDGSVSTVVSNNIETGSPQSNVVASASTIQLDPALDYFIVTGTTDIATIDTSSSPFRTRWAGRVVSLEFQGVLNVKHGTGNIRLTNVADITTSALTVLTLRYDSTNGVWVQTNWQPADYIEHGYIRAIPRTTPATPTAGQVYYDGATNKLRCYNGTTWNDLF